MDLSIIIVSYNTVDLTRRCLQAVGEHGANIKHEIIVVDNASNDGTADMVATDFPSIKLIRLSGNLGFAAGNNRGLAVARGRYLLLLNSDAFIGRGALENSISFMENHPRTGVLGCKLTDPDGAHQPSARMLPGPLNKFLHLSGLAAHFSRSRFFGRVDYSWWDHAAPRNVGWVVGAYFLIRQEAYRDIGPLDERYFLYFEEIDYCLTAHRRGWEVTFYPLVKVVHLGGQSSPPPHVTTKGRQQQAIRIKSEFRYYRKNHGIGALLIAAAIELGWNLLVILKNSMRPDEASVNRRQAALTTNGIIFQTLWRERLGRKIENQTSA